MLARRLALLPLAPLACLLAALAACTPAATPAHDDTLTTLASLTGSALFKSFEFAIDSTSGDSIVRTYRPPRTSVLRKQIAMRIRADSSGNVLSISLGFQSRFLHQAAMFDLALGEFMEAMIPKTDSLAIQPFVIQVRNGSGFAVDSGFLARSADDTVLPRRPSQTYLALLGQRELEEEEFSRSQLRITRLLEANDTVVVVSLSTPDGHVTAGHVSDWVDARHIDPLGASVDELLSSDLVLGLQLTVAERSARDLFFTRREGGFYLRAMLDAAQRVSRLTLTMPDASSMKLPDSSMQPDAARMLMLAAVALVPQRDSADAARAAYAKLLDITGPLALAEPRVAAFIRRDSAVATYDVGTSTVQIAHSMNGTEEYAAISVGARGSFAPTTAATAPTPARSRREKRTP
jgi:hypothetical protein